MFLHLVKWIKYCSLIIFVHCCNRLFFFIQTLKIAVSFKTLMTRTPTVDQGLVVTLNSTHLTHFRNLPGGDKQSMSDLESTPLPPHQLRTLHNGVAGCFVVCPGDRCSPVLPDPL